MSESKEPIVPTLPIAIEPLVSAIKEILPTMISGRDKAVARMSQIVAIEDDQALEVINKVLGNAKDAAEKISAMRMNVTRPLDELKANLMQYEKDIKSEDERIRKIVAAYNQVKINKRLAEEREAAAKRAKEDYKVELVTRIKQSLLTMVSDRTMKTEDWSRNHFEQATVEDFDAKAKQYNGITPKLDQKFYDACFGILFDANKLNQEEFNALIAELKATESYDKWNKEVMDKIVPILNHWRGKIHELKQQKIDIAKADADEKQRLLDQQKINAKAEQDRRNEEFAKQTAQAQENLKNESEVNKMGNLFQEQAVVQTLDPKGNTTKQLRFTDDANTVKPLANVMFYCSLSPKFPGVFRKDKEGSFVLDQHGNREYVDHVAWWMDFFVKNCKEKVEGTEVIEVAKVIVRR